MTFEEINRLPIFFIVGMGRSGTTLLRTMLDAGQETILPPEAKVIVHLKQKYNHKKKWNINLVDELLVDLYSDKKYVRSWQIDKEILRETILNYPIEKLSFSFICKLIYLSYSSIYQKTTIKIIGDKNPIHSIFIGELLEVFPDAKFIHIVRDYRDCVLSNAKLFKRKNISALVVLWKIYNYWISIYNKQYPDRFFLIRYEDLVTYPDQKMIEICAFLGISFSSSMVQHDDELNKYFNKDVNITIQYTHPNLLNKVNTSSVAKWESEFSEIEKEKLTYHAGEFAKLYNYAPYLNYKNSNYYFNSLNGYLVNIKDIFVVKGYFLLPFIIRNFIKKSSRFIFDKTGYYTVFNQDDVIGDIAKKKYLKSIKP